VSFEWRILRVSPIGLDPQTITVNDEIARLQEISVEPNGNCLECSFEGLPSALPIGVRDVLTIETRPDNVSAWTPLYRGVVVLAGNPRSPRVQQYRCVGLKQRLYEVIANNVFRLDGADAATMATAAFNSLTFDSTPTGVDTTSIDAPATGFTLGDRYPQYESVGSLLDYLASSVGTFIVPSGDSYSYDGDTYDGFEEVPATAWGVRADGSVFFRRPNQVTPTAVTEGSAGVEVDWPSISGEGIVTNPLLMVASGFSPDIKDLQFAATGLGTNPVPPVGVPISYQDENRLNPAAVARLIETTDGFSFMKAETLLAITTTGWTNAANTQDGDPTTFAEQTGTTNTLTMSLGTTVGDYGRVAPGNLGWLLTLDIEFAADQPWELRINVNGSTTGIGSIGEYYFVSPDTRVGTRYRAVLPINVPADQAQHAQDTGAVIRTANLRFRVNSAAPTGVKIYDARLWSLDNFALGGLAAAERFATAFRIPVAPEAASVTLPGLQPLTNSIAVTPVIGLGPVTIPVIRTQYEITSNRGVVTTYLAGEAFDGALNVQRAVLQELAANTAQQLVRIDRSVVR
jgi:hypothetical protein